MGSEQFTKVPHVPLLELMGVFFRVGITSFGGSTAAWLYRELVERRGWLDEDHFLTALTLAQVLPGANPVNLSIYVGSQLRGGIGGAAAALGMIGPPFCIILARSRSRRRGCARPYRSSRTAQCHPVLRESAPAAGARAREHLERPGEVEHLDIVEDQDADLQFVASVI